MDPEEPERETTTGVRAPLLDMLRARRAVCAQRDAPASPQTLYLQNFIDLSDWEELMGQFREVVPTVERFDTERVEEKADGSLDGPIWC